jgi:hypothetical protein
MKANDYRPEGNECESCGLKIRTSCPRPKARKKADESSTGIANNIPVRKRATPKDSSPVTQP